MKIKNLVGLTVHCVYLEQGGHFGGALVFHTDAGIFEVYDSAQHCCERRFLHTDDELRKIRNERIIRIDKKRITSEDKDSYRQEDVQFVDFYTNKRLFTICAHNIHNGYYGGFNLVMTRKSGNEN